MPGIVWKFFERVEGVLKDETKKEIAAWLLDAKAERDSPQVGAVRDRLVERPVLFIRRDAAKFLLTQLDRKI